MPHTGVGGICLGGGRRGLYAAGMVRQGRDLVRGVSEQPAVHGKGVRAGCAPHKKGRRSLLWQASLPGWNPEQYRRVKHCYSQFDWAVELVSRSDTDCQIAHRGVRLIKKAAEASSGKQACQSRFLQPFLQCFTRTTSFRPFRRRRRAWREFLP